MKVALVHDFLIRFGGAERVFLSLKRIFPKADIYTLLYDRKRMGKFFPDEKIRTAFVQKFPFWHRYHRLLAPLMPSAIESLDLRDYDLVISSSSAFAKGLIIRPKTIHICYCHTPTRYVWDYSCQYDSRLAPLRKILVHYLRLWDRAAANRVDYFIANSKTTADRIKKYYGRRAKIIYPPVCCHSERSEESRGENCNLRDSSVASLPQNDRNKNVNFLQNGIKRRDYFLIVSQLTPHKRIDLAVEVCNKLEIPLIIIGEGRDAGRLKRMARSNITFLGWRPDEIVKKYYQNCFAFIFPGEDDFGIAPVEAMSFGKPVLAFGRGGAKETILEGITGEFFDDLAVESLADGIRRLKLNVANYRPEIIRQRAQKFSEEKFDVEIKKFVIEVVEGEKRT